MTNVVPFPGAAPVADALADPADERTFLHCSHCHSSHFVVEIIDEDRRKIRCGLAGCEQVIQDMVWWEGDQ